MYAQEIVISPDIFEKISKAFTPGYDEDIDLKSYKENLKLKLVLFDKNENGESILEDKIKEITHSSSDFGRQKIDVILKSLIQSGKIDYKTIPKMKEYCKDKIINQIFNLSLLSESKIINSENTDTSTLILKHSELKDFEVLDFENFIKPRSNSKVYSLEKNLRCKTGDVFKFEEYLLPYLIDAKSVHINDRYLRTRNGLSVLLKLISLCKNMRELKISTICRNYNINDNFEYSISDFKSVISNIVKEASISIENTNKTIGKSRFLETENYHITFEPGIDFVNKDYIAEKNPVTITIECTNK